MRVRIVGCLCVAGLAVGSSVLSADHHEAPAQPQMSAEQAAMMAAFEKAATPGPEHAWLASTAGSWTFQGTSWMGPGGPETRFAGSEERTMLLGGRVMMSKVTATIDNMPFEGMGLNGFDNVTKKFWGSWSDNMSTGPMTVRGTCAAGKCEYESVASDPTTGGTATGRMVSEQMADHEHVVMYAKGPDGKEFKAMEFHYTRKK
jgi:hypothetical protein